MNPFVSKQGRSLQQTLQFSTNSIACSCPWTVELVCSAVASEPFSGDCPTGLFSSHVGQCFQSCQRGLFFCLGAVLLAIAEWVRSAIILVSASNELLISSVQQSAAELAGSAIASEPFPGDCPTGLFSSRAGQCFQSCQSGLFSGLGAILLATAEWVRSAIILVNASCELLIFQFSCQRAPTTAELAGSAVASEPCPGDCPTGLFSSHAGQCSQSCQSGVFSGLGAVLLATAEWVLSAIILVNASNELSVPLSACPNDC